MNVYLDASVLVKRYVTEAGSPEVAMFLADVVRSGTSGITVVEVTAALTRAAPGRLSGEASATACAAFFTEWPALIRLQPLEPLLDHAREVALRRRLRGYDAVHLASAIRFQELVEEPVTLATADQELWSAAPLEGLAVWPDDLVIFHPRRA